MVRARRVARRRWASGGGRAAGGDRCHDGLRHHAAGDPAPCRGCARRCSNGGERPHRAARGAAGPAAHLEARRWLREMWRMDQDSQRDDWSDPAVPRAGDPPFAWPPRELRSAPSSPGACWPARGAGHAAARRRGCDGGGFAQQGGGARVATRRGGAGPCALEALTREAADARSWPNLSPSVAQALRTARNENRAALGVPQQAPAGEVTAALARVSARLRADDRAGALAALAPPLFEPGGEVTLERLGALGPLPAAEQASAALAREVRRLDLDRGWSGAGNWWQSARPAPSPTARARLLTGRSGMRRRGRRRPHGQPFGRRVWAPVLRAAATPTCAQIPFASPMKVIATSR